MLDCAPNAPQEAVLLVASAGRLRPALRALPDAPLADVGRVLLGWLASCSDPRAAWPARPAPYALMRACRFWAGPQAPLGMRDTLGYALRHSDTLCLAFAGCCITMRAQRGVDAAGMWDGVEVVGDKYSPYIGEFCDPHSPAYFTALEGWRGVQPGECRPGLAIGEAA